MHVNTSAALVKRLVETQFPQWAHLPVRPVEHGGWDNRTFHLGDDMSVRLPSAERYAEKVEKEQEWLPRLAPHLPLPIPQPLAMGTPDHGYPWNWSVYRWIEGTDASAARIEALTVFAESLAEFLRAMQRIDASDGLPAGAHNFHRGGSLMVYDQQTRDAIAALDDNIDGKASTAVWEAALQSMYRGDPVWVHGDVAPGNLLVRDGQLCAVIDFGGCGVGDPACDLTIAWTFFSGAGRTVFRNSMAQGEAMWARARGWALWKALITRAEHIAEANPARKAEAQRVIDAVLAESVSRG